MKKEELEQASGREEFINIAWLILVILTLRPVWLLGTTYWNADKANEPYSLYAVEIGQYWWQFSVMLALTTITFGVGRIVSTLDRYEQKQN